MENRRPSNEAHEVWVVKELSLSERLSDALDLLGYSMLLIVVVIWESLWAAVYRRAPKSHERCLGP